MQDLMDFVGDGLERALPGLTLTATVLVLFGRWLWTRITELRATVMRLDAAITDMRTRAILHGAWDGWVAARLQSHGEPVPPCPPLTDGAAWVPPDIPPPAPPSA